MDMVNIFKLLALTLGIVLILPVFCQFVMLFLRGWE